MASRAVAGLLVLLLLLVVVTPLLVLGQAVVCEPFDNAPQPCQSFLVGNWSWVATYPSVGISQEVLHAQMLQPLFQTPTTFVSLLDALTLLDLECGIAYARALCLAFFNPCDPSGQQPVVVPVCRSVCLHYLQVCGEQAPLPTLCDEPINLIANTSMMIFQDTDDCRTNGDDFTDEPFIYPCPAPTLFRAHPPSSVPCKTPCKQQLHIESSKREFDHLFITVSVLSWISMFASLAVIAVYAYFPALREYPSRMAIFVTMGNLVVNIAWVGNSVQEPNDFMCDSNGVDLTTSGWCAFSGFAVYYGSMLLATWWCLQVVVMTYNVGFKQYNKRLDQKYEWVLHIWGWGYPLVSALVVSFVPNGHGVGALGVVPYCVGSLRQPTGLRWGLFTGVVCFYFLVASIGLAITLVQMVAMGLKSALSAKKQVASFLSIFAFGLWYLVAVASVIVENSYEQATSDRAASSGSDLIQCWFTTNDWWQDCHRSFLFDYGILWWGGIMTALTGTVLFLVFIPMNAKARHAFASRSSSLAMSINNS